MLIFPSNGKQQQQQKKPFDWKKKIVAPEKEVKHVYSCLTQFRVLYQKIP